MNLAGVKMGKYVNKQICPIKLIGVLVLFFVRFGVRAQQQYVKELYLPSKIWRVPEANDYRNEDSEYSYSRKVESENIAIFWAKEYGDDPKNHINSTKRFDPIAILAQCERFYMHYRDTVKMVQRGKSLTDMYKLLFFVIGGDEGTAFGGGAADSVGVLWASSLRLQYPPYGAVAHEMAHCFQYLAKSDGAWAYSSSVAGSRGHAIFEMGAQYLLWQVYPDWMNFENYHLKSFMDKTHYAFLHETNMYHSPYVFEYWSMLHGTDFHGRLWREARVGEDAVLTYQRLHDMNQDTFNDELFDGYRRFMTWDLPRVQIYAAPYANQHTTQLIAESDDSYRIDSAVAPQNYGYNGIKLVVPPKGTSVKLHFTGMAGQEGYRLTAVENAGWRYGFVAMKKNGERVYGTTGKDVRGDLVFPVPEQTEHLWLVVSGAPIQHSIHLLDGDDANDEQWGYQFRLDGTIVHPDVLVVKR
ncbi:DUF6055 domain-containing protein [Sphingobacterium pedocola]|uniref:Avirulence protein n=1 Tax=Sphingobacterium pedocola TaxID=2082722 RepID=A0ABR9TAN6_9SPHI|nr:DUF6055 domain-containing protein [Sphingobacterium pedocola]MBE8722403.1 hypothetical protein [Sphingobacterium pedocola]